MDIKNKKVARMEQIFDISYMLIVFFIGIYMIVRNSSIMQVSWGIMALVLIFGDSFHLIPRIISAQDSTKTNYKALGFGKLMTSITMTIFYIILWYHGLQLANLTQDVPTVFIWILALIRILICLLPQNGWIKKESNYQFGIYRNIPFLIQGLLTSWLYAQHDTGLPWMWLAILLSFAFYLPVVLFADKKPKFGMFMLPKTLVYVWMIVMGFQL